MINLSPLPDARAIEMINFFFFFGSSVCVTLTYTFIKDKMQRGKKIKGSRRENIYYLMRNSIFAQDRRTHINFQFP